MEGEVPPFYIAEQEQFVNTMHQHPYISRIQYFMERLDPDAKQALDQLSETKTVRKGEHLLRPGERCRSSFWVQQGILRKYILHHGTERTTEFFFADDLAVAFSSYCLQVPGEEGIEALTDGVVLLTPFDDFQALKKQYPVMIELDLMMTEYYAMMVEDRSTQFHHLDAKERYLRLLEMEPHILLEVPLTHIASYLGITLASLSRIRAQH
jgi:CRP-like cAMP-binding protein